MSHATIADIRASGALNSFPDRELHALLGATDLKLFEPGSLICTEGTAGTSCFILLSGEVDVFAGGPSAERPLASLRAGAVVGQIALVDHKPRTATVRARSRVTALELTRDKFEVLLRAHSPLAIRFQMQIAMASARQLREASTRLTSVLESAARLQARARRAPAAVPAEAAPPTSPAARSPGTGSERHDQALRFLQAATQSLDIPVDALEEIETSTPPPQMRRRPPSR